MKQMVEAVGSLFHVYAAATETHGYKRLTIAASWRVGRSKTLFAIYVSWQLL